MSSLKKRYFYFLKNVIQIIKYGKPYDIRTESYRAELMADIPEGISSLKYYVPGPAGNRPDIIGK